MVSQLELEFRYNKYLESFEDANLIGYQGESVDKPTKRNIQDEDFNIEIRNASINGSKNLLLANDTRRAGIRYLPPDLLAWLPVKLTNVLQANICKDHREFWWFTHDFARAFNEETELFPKGLIDNLELLIRLITSEPIFGYSKQMRRVREIMDQSKTLAAYLAYPTFEGFVKVACNNDIKLNGEIREGKKIRRLTRPDKREYFHHDDGDGICSNLGMLLWHLETEVARPKHSNLMSEMREEVGEIFDHPPEYIYGLLNDFRNDSLHGRNRAPKEHGVFLNYVCLIVWIILLQ